MSYPLTAAQSLRGDVTVPGDKSISHRAVMFGALADADTHITGFLMGEDCLSTISCFKKMGVSIDVSEKEVVVHGVGLHGLKAPDELLYTGNSGTTTRLLCGILAGQPFSSTVNGDASIQKRPMGRIMNPLREMGADISGKDGNLCPLTIHPAPLHGIRYTMPVASAQLKSAILLAGLFADSSTTVVETAPSRDHTERMLRGLGAQVVSNGTEITLTPPKTLHAVNVEVPGDISSAAYFLVAGLILPDSDIVIRNVGINPTRTGILDALEAMGANIERLNERGTVEPICDLRVRSSHLHGTTICGDMIPRLIDEIPVLAVAAAFAEGETVRWVLCTAWRCAERFPTPTPAANGSALRTALEIVRRGRFVMARPTRPVPSSRKPIMPSSLSRSMYTPANTITCNSTTTTNGLPFAIV